VSRGPATLNATWAEWLCRDLVPTVARQRPGRQTELPLELEPRRAPVAAAAPRQAGYRERNLRRRLPARGHAGSRVIWRQRLGFVSRLGQVYSGGKSISETVGAASTEARIAGMAGGGQPHSSARWHHSGLAFPNERPPARWISHGTCHRHQFGNDHRSRCFPPTRARSIATRIRADA